ncbi:Ribonuclease H [Termitomyces sp. J132]|nr:Ribonuclease H [Termitomyces sp. J132]
MPKASKGKKFYAVQKGRQTGVFLTWTDCEKQTKGFPGARYQSFTNAADAEAFVSGSSSKDPGPFVPSRSDPYGYVAPNAKGKKRAMSKDLADETEHDIVYCDGACKGNGQLGSVAGVGVWWEENDPRNIAERCPGDQTNNRAELIAIVRMLETTPKSKRPLLIKTDSQYCIKCFFQWLPKWRYNNFRTSGGNPVKNVEIIKYVSALLEVRALVGQPVRMEYVKGHSGDRGNDGADAQANKGALLPSVPERDWAKAKQELLEGLREEGSSEVQPRLAPLDFDAGVLEQSTNQPHKVRKVSHDQPFSRMSSAPASTESRNLEPLSTESSNAQVRSRSLPSISPHHPLPIIEVSSLPPQATGPSQPPPPPLPIIEVPSSSPQETGPSQAQPPPPPSPCNTGPVQPGNIKVVSPMDSQLSREESSKPSKTPKTPVRKHGMGLFTTTPPPNAGLVRRFSTLPCESQEARESELVRQAEEKIARFVGEPMAVNVVGIAADLNEAQKLELVPKDQEEIENSMEKPITMNVDAVDVDPNDVKESEPAPSTQEETAKPMVMSIDAADVDLDDYLDCVDDEDDPFNDI